MAHLHSDLSLDQLKQQARHLRTSLGASGTTINHAKSLELLAHQHGSTNWHVLHAALGNSAPAQAERFPPQLGDRVSGRYLGQAFAGEVIGAAKLAGDRYRVTLDFDEAVDVVRFDSFSAFRKRVTAIVDRRGVSAEKTSDGEPHMRLDP